MQSKLTGFLFAALCAVSIPAQAAIVSPIDFQSAAGSVALPFSAGPGTRWQQVHGDLIGTPSTFVGLRLRRDEQVPALPNAASRSIDVEVWLAETDLSLVSADFGQNLWIAPVQVLPPTTILLPDWSLGGGGFDLDLPFASPYGYSGGFALVVEVRILADAQPASHIVDGFAEARQQLPALDIGVGCTVGLAPFTQASGLLTGQALFGRLDVDWSLRAFFAPPGAFGFFVIGAATQSQLLPGACAPMLPTFDATVMATTIDTPLISLLVAPRITSLLAPGMVGTSVFTQAVAVEVGPGGMRLVMSQPQQLTVAPPPPAPRPIVSLEGTLASPMATSIDYGGRVLQLVR
jgi:hypothetical protein